MDTGDDFYTYVNGGWMEATEPPVGFSRTFSFKVVQFKTEEQIQTIVDGILAKNWPAKERVRIC